MYKKTFLIILHMNLIIHNASGTDSPRTRESAVSDEGITYERIATPPHSVASTVRPDTPDTPDTPDPVGIVGPISGVEVTTPTTEEPNTPTGVGIGESRNLNRFPQTMTDSTSTPNPGVGIAPLEEGVTITTG